MTDRTILLPCGTPATIQPFNGVSQKHLQKVAEALAEDRRLPEGDIETEVLHQCLAQLDGARPDEARLLRLRTGSRLRALTEARILTYGTALDLYLVCCQRDAADKPAPIKVGFDLRTLQDTPYPKGDTVSVQTVSTGGTAYTFELRWPTGRTQKDYLGFVARGMVSKGDLGLCQIVGYNGEPHGIRDVMELPGDVLDAVRNVTEFMEPRRFLDSLTDTGERREVRWWSRVKAILDEQKVVVTWAGKPETPPVPPSASADAPSAELPVAPLLPVGGFPTMVQVACPHCEKPHWTNVYGQPDFFFRRVARRLD